MKHHLSVGIKGLEDRLFGRVPKRYGSWEVLQHENGAMLTKTEVIAEIARCRSLGYEVIPTCDNIDARGFCKGHES